MPTPLKRMCATESTVHGTRSPWISGVAAPVARSNSNAYCDVTVRARIVAALTSSARQIKLAPLGVVAWNRSPTAMAASAVLRSVVMLEFCLVLQRKGSAQEL